MNTKITTMLFFLLLVFNMLSQNINRKNLSPIGISELKIFKEKQKQNHLLQESNTQLKTQGLLSVSSASNNNIDFEVGNFIGWTLTGGFNMISMPTPSIIPSLYASSIASVVDTTYFEFVIPQKIVSPLGGNYVAQLNYYVSGSSPVCKIAQNTFSVTTSNNILNIAYLPIFQTAGHICTNQPFLLINIRNALGNIINQKFIQANESIFGAPCSGTNGNGFYLSPTAYFPTLIKNWQTYCVDLSSQVGKNITIEVIAADCTIGDHGGYAYVDFTTSSSPTPYFTVNTNTFALTQGDTLFLCGTTATVIPPSTANSVNWHGNVNVTSSTSTPVVLPAVGLYTVSYQDTASPCLPLIYITNYIKLDSNCTPGSSGGSGGSNNYSSCGNLNITYTCSSTSNGAATALINGTATPNYNFTWSNGITTASATSSTIYNLAPGNYSFTANSTNCILDTNNLIQNPDFNVGYSGFSSQYQQIPSPFPPYLSPNTTGWTWITTNPHPIYGNFYGLGYGGSGNYLLLDGATNPSLTAWSETVTVNSNSNYNFSFYIQSVDSAFPLYGRAQLNVRINSVSIGTIYAPPTSNTWIPFNGLWASGTNTTAIITIEDMNTNGMYNDFGIDHISFNACNFCTYTGTVNVPVCLVTSADKNTAISDLINIYPNPTSGNVNIVSSTEITKIIVYNYLGQEISVAKTSNNIELENLARGIYFIQVHTPKGIINKRIEKN
ncbi:MAG: T9SS type A sorting domain-containing protein [Bacteroidetes bacterium]|nr:T9SS type A sorting domain-containing protein [Bacteroidota bacterium]